MDPAIFSSMHGERLQCALACSHCAMHLYEYQHPGDSRLRVALDLLIQSLEDQFDGPAVPGVSGDQLVAAMWEVEKARAGDVEESVVSMATGAVVFMCRAALGRLEGQSQEAIDIEAFQACWYAAQAIRRAFSDEPDGNTATASATLLTRQDIHALGQAFVLWHDYWFDQQAGPVNDTA
jgi:hypothetical protein